MRQMTPTRGGRCRTARARPAGFTLTELMVVIAVLALLAAMLMPYFARTFELAYSALCKNNLKSIAQSMHMIRGRGADGAMTVPSPTGWVSQALAFGSSEMLLCLKDTEDRITSRGDLKDLYVIQYSHDGKVYVSYVLDLLEGRPVPDDQVWIDWWLGGPAHCKFSGVCNCCWSPDELKPRQHVIGVDGSTAIKITLGDIIEIEALQTCFSISQPGGSRHFLRIGPANPSEDDQELLHLTGEDYHVVDPRSPLRLCGVRTSYGMSAFVRERGWRPRQIMLMDANDITVGIENGTHGETIIEDVIAPRHLGKVNTVRVDQSVGTMGPLALERELLGDSELRREP
ncbi:MAG TPA: prepilin-type N-terminal cleavage/methylation domain-containing protein [Phycisphaerae bacterium]|nr:prepilin-type N-terminal cleavage/methylation domain-containing protein [Phycisphaerae bacterium]